MINDVRFMGLDLVSWCLLYWYRVFKSIFVLVLIA